jgi:hypothetical protein
MLFCTYRFLLFNKFLITRHDDTTTTQMCNSMARQLHVHASASDDIAVHYSPRITEWPRCATQCQGYSTFTPLPSRNHTQQRRARYLQPNVLCCTWFLVLKPCAWKLSSQTNLHLHGKHDAIDSSFILCALIHHIVPKTNLFKRYLQTNFLLQPQIPYLLIDNRLWHDSAG